MAANSGPLGPFQVPVRAHEEGGAAGERFPKPLDLGWETAADPDALDRWGRFLESCRTAVGGLPGVERSGLLGDGARLTELRPRRGWTVAVEVAHPAVFQRLVLVVFPYPHDEAREVFQLAFELEKQVWRRWVEVAAERAWTAAEGVVDRRPRHGELFSVAPTWWGLEGAIESFDLVVSRGNGRRCAVPALVRPRVPGIAVADRPLPPVLFHRLRGRLLDDARALLGRHWDRVVEGGVSQEDPYWSRRLHWSRGLLLPTAWRVFHRDFRAAVDGRRTPADEPRYSPPAGGARAPRHPEPRDPVVRAALERPRDSDAPATALPSAPDPALEADLEPRLAALRECPGFSRWLAGLAGCTEVKAALSLLSRILEASGRLRERITRSRPPGCGQLRFWLDVEEVARETTRTVVPFVEHLAGRGFPAQDSEWVAWKGGIEPAAAQGLIHVVPSLLRQGRGEIGDTILAAMRAHVVGALLTRLLAPLLALQVETGPGFDAESTPEELEQAAGVGRLETLAGEALAVVSRLAVRLDCQYVHIAPYVSSWEQVQVTLGDAIHDAVTRTSSWREWLGGRPVPVGASGRVVVARVKYPPLRFLAGGLSRPELVLVDLGGG